MTPSLESCAICNVIIERRFIERTEHGVVFEPDNKVIDGHLIVAPLVHIIDAAANPVISAQVMRLAAMTAKPPCSIIIPVGQMAGQAHSHMYMHIIPAAAGQPKFIKMGRDPI